MRFVIYDDESFEPITVIDLPFTNRDLPEITRRGNWRIPIPPKLSVVDYMAAEAVPEFEHFRTVDVWFERLVRKGQEQVMCFTKAADLAMLLEPAWLPGQRPAIDQILDERDRLSDALLHAMMLNLRG